MLGKLDAYWQCTCNHATTRARRGVTACSVPARTPIWVAPSRVAPSRAGQFVKRARCPAPLPVAWCGAWRGVPCPVGYTLAGAAALNLLRPPPLCVSVSVCAGAQSDARIVGINVWHWTTVGGTPDNPSIVPFYHGVDQMPAVVARLGEIARQIHNGSATPRRGGA